MSKKTENKNGDSEIPTEKAILEIQHVRNDMAERYHKFRSGAEAMIELADIYGFDHASNFLHLLAKGRVSGEKTSKEVGLLIEHLTYALEALDNLEDELEDDVVEDFQLALLFFLQQRGTLWRSISGLIMSIDDTDEAIETYINLIDKKARNEQENKK